MYTHTSRHVLVIYYTDHDAAVAGAAAAVDQLESKREDTGSISNREQIHIYQRQEKAASYCTSITQQADFSSEAQAP